MKKIEATVWGCKQHTGYIVTLLDCKECEYHAGFEDESVLCLYIKAMERTVTPDFYAKFCSKCNIGYKCYIDSDMVHVVCENKDSHLNVEPCLYLKYSSCNGPKDIRVI